MVKQFSRRGGKVEFFKEVEIFRDGFKLLLERWNWDFLMKGSSRDYFKRVEKFSEGIKDFWRD